MSYIRDAHLTFVVHTGTIITASALSSLSFEEAWRLKQRERKIYANSFVHLNKKSSIAYARVKHLF